MHFSRIIFVLILDATALRLNGKLSAAALEAELISSPKKAKPSNFIDNGCEKQVPAVAPFGELQALMENGCQQNDPSFFSKPKKGLEKKEKKGRHEAWEGLNGGATYAQMATIAESVYDASGLRAEKHQISEKHLYVHSKFKKSSICNLPQYANALKTFPIRSKWTDDTKNQVKELYTYAHGVSPEGLNDTEKCNRLAASSLAWRMKNGHVEIEPASETDLNMKQIVQEHHRWLEAFYGSEQAKKQSAQDCYVFPKPKEKLCGGMAQYPDLVSELEYLHPGGRNLMYHEFGNLIDFTPYRPLPSLANFNSNSIKGEKVLIIAGANGFYRATKHLIDMYSPYFEFDRVIMIEPDAEGMEVPAAYNRTGNIEFMKTFVAVKSCDSKDLVKYLQNSFHEEDYVVVMFDVDESNNPSGPTMEWGFLADLVGQKKRVVDELFIELHMHQPDLKWGYNRHSAQEQYDLMHQLRHVCGAAVHAWP